MADDNLKKEEVSDSEVRFMPKKKGNGFKGS